MPGPPPKRSEERRRRNKDGVETLKVNLDETLAGEIEIPAPPTKEIVDKETGEILGYESKWHPIAEDLYLSLTKSGQSIFYEPSDWALAYAMCESLSREFSPKPMVVQVGEGATEVQWVKQPVNGAVLGQVNKMLAMLMAAEGSRRTLRIELDRKKHQEARLSGDGVVVPLVQQRQDLFR